MMGQKYSPPIIVRVVLAISCLALTLLIGARRVSPQQLPVRTYTTADGLPRDFVLRIDRGSRGFLWLCTRDVFSRFNAYDFPNYGLEQELPNPALDDLLETRRRRH